MAKEFGIKEKAGEETFHLLLESVPDALVFVDSGGRIFMVNKQAEELFGYSREELLGKEVEALIPERFRGHHRKYLADYFSAPRMRAMGVGLDLRGLTKEGMEFPVDISLSPVTLGNEVFVIADIRDITERKQAEEKVRRSYHFQRTVSSILQISLLTIPLEEQLGRILDVILTVPWLTDLAMGSIYLVEDEPGILIMKAQKNLPQKIIDSCSRVSFGDCLCGLGASTGKIVFTSSIDERHSIPAEESFPHGHYSVPIMRGGSVLGLLNLYVKDGHDYDEQEETLLSSVADTIANIIVYKQSELEKEKLHEQLVQSEKMSALGRVTANVAHDIRNPLTVVGGFMRRLNRSIHPGTKEKEYAALIITEVTRLEKILRNVLTYSRRTSLRKEECDINDLLNEFIRTYEVICREKSINIDLDLSDLTRVPLDIEQTSEAINNILSNAIEAMPRGGTLTVKSLEEKIDKTPYVCVRIEDTGEGIPEDSRDVIFEPFYSTKVAGHGAGLGLSISKKIVENHGGFITVESRNGKGSVFSLCFPSQDREANSSSTT